MAHPQHDASEGGYQLHDVDSQRVEMMATVNARAAAQRQHDKLRPKSLKEVHIDGDKIPEAAREGDESINEDDEDV